MSEQLALEPEKAVRLDTPHARNLLRNRYPAGEWALMEEVAPRTGGGTRYADAIAVNLWASRGHATHGFEIKVSRSDWLRELKQPEKADELVAFCDYWWVVAPAGIIKPGELPPTWGHLEVQAARLMTKAEAPKLQAQPITRAFFASIMRRSYEGLDRQVDLMAMRKQAQAVIDLEKTRAKYEKDARRELDKLQAKIAEFEEKTGLSFGNAWQGPPVAAIKVAQQLHKLNGYDGEPLGKLARLAETLESAAKEMREALAARDGS